MSSSDPWDSSSSSESESETASTQSNDDNANQVDQRNDQVKSDDNNNISDKSDNNNDSAKSDSDKDSAKSDSDEDSAKSDSDKDSTKSDNDEDSAKSDSTKNSSSDDDTKSSDESQSSIDEKEIAQTQSKPKIENVPSFPSLDQGDPNAKLARTMPYQNPARRNSTTPSAFSMTSLTPGTTFLKSQMSTSKLSSLEERLRKTDDDDGVISQVFTTNRSRALSMSTASIPNVMAPTEPDNKGIPPFTYEPGPEYVAPNTDQQYSDADSQISEFIQNHQNLQSYSWNDSMIKNIDEKENPYFSPYADYLKAKDSESANYKFQSAIPVQMFSEKVRRVEMQDLTDPDREEVQLSKSITYTKDTNKPESDDRQPPSVFNSYFISQPPLIPRFSLNPVKEEQLSQNKAPYLGLTLKEFTMDPRPLEPFFFTAYLYTNKKFISEEWHFAPDSAVDIYKDSSTPIEINLNKQGVFELPLDFDSEAKFKSTFVVIAVSHPITIEGNVPVNKYYLKGSGFEVNAKLNIAKTFPNRNADILTAFAYSFVSLSDILKETSQTDEGAFQFGQYTFKNFYALNAPFCCQKIKDHIQESMKKKAKEGDLKIKISVDVNFKKVLHPSIDFQGYDLINLIEVPPPATHPSVRLCHKIAIHIDQVTFKLPKGVKGRNVYGEISLKTDENADGLKCLHSQLNPQNLTTLGKTRCFYHEPKGIFDEVFVFDLPYPIPPKLFIHCDFYHLVLKKSSDSKLWIGHVCVPIFETPNTFIKNGQHTYTVRYKHGERGNDSKIDPNNCLTFSTLISSNLIPADEKLCAFYSNVSDSDSLKDANKDEMLQNFYVVVENLIEYIKTSPITACKGLNVVYNLLKDDLKEKLDQYFQIYAQVFAFRNPSPDYHHRLLEGLGGCEALPAGLYQFLFMLIIKSIYLTNDKSFGKSFAEFLEGAPVAIAQNPTKEAVVEYAKFINLLMDIGCYGASIEGAIAMLYHLKKRQEVTVFVYEVFHPKFLYLSVMNSDRMVDAIVDLFNYARVGNEQVFQYLNYAISVLPKEIKKEIAQRLLDTLIAISPLEKMPFAHFCPNGRVHPVIIYFSFILECMTECEQIHEWISSIENPSDFFDSLHFILDITAVDNNSTLLHREITYSIQAALLNLMTIMINVNEQMRELGFLTYHVLCSNIVADFLPILMSIPTIIAQKDITFLFKYYCPPLPKILVNLFKVSKNEKNSLVDFIKTLFEKDREKYGDTRRSLALITRSLYQLNPYELQRTLKNLKEGINAEEEDENEENDEDIYRCDDKRSLRKYYNRGSLRFLIRFVNDYIETNRLLSIPSNDIETKSQLFWKLIQMFQYSPDVTIELLNKLSDANLEADYVDEAIQAKLLIAAIVLEHLTLQNRIKPLFNEYHAAKVFENICSLTNFATYKDDDCPHIIGYCDSPKFNLKSLISLLIHLTKMSFNNKSQMQTYEHAIDLIGIVWPILENQKSFYYTQRFFKIEHTVQMMLSKIPADKDPLYGHYFRVAFFGDCFGPEDGKTYIYHEKMLTHLFELSTRLVDKYKAKFEGSIPIELIKEAGEVDLTKLNTKGAGYIQVTFVEPFFPKTEQLLRTSDYDRSHMIRTFMFDTPFTQNSKVAQGSIEHQWIRRTLLTVRNRMPSIFKIEEVTSIVNKDFEPIKVSYRQLRDRCTKIQAAISQNSFRNIQQLLHGSLLTMVNEGPSRMAEVFLTNSDNLEGDPAKMDKYQDKLRKTFKLFLTVNEEALKLHAIYVASNPMFIPLQNELEAGLQSLKDKLGKYVDMEEDEDFLN